MENYSLTDSGGIWILIILFFLGLGGGMFGNRYQDSATNTYATAASQQEILFGQQFQNLNAAINKVGDGLCSSTYALNNAITTEGRSIQQQISTSCCENQKNVDSLRFDMANYYAQLNSNIDNKFAALEKSQLEQRLAEQQNQINQMYINQQMCGVVRYPNALTYNAGGSPFCNGGCCNV